ncbi:MAG: hypothetical protein JWP44_91 [Mucilaginibacter sp.]|nr:hypothetical protein [Mucilaginibacter sp.]
MIECTVDELDKNTPKHYYTSLWICQLISRNQLTNLPAFNIFIYTLKRGVHQLINGVYFKL